MQALFDLEATNSELKADLRDLYITSAREIDVHGTNRKSIIVHVRPGIGWRRDSTMWGCGTLGAALPVFALHTAGHPRNKPPNAVLSACDASVGVTGGCRRPRHRIALP